MQNFSEWEQEAIRELIDCLQMLSAGAFLSADDYCNRVEVSHRAIRAIYGAQPSATQIRLMSWRQQVRSLETMFEDLDPDLKDETEDPGDSL